MHQSIRNLTLALITLCTTVLTVNAAVTPSTDRDIPASPPWPSPPPMTLPGPQNPNDPCPSPPGPIVPLPLTNFCEDLKRDNACKNPISPDKWWGVVLGGLQGEMAGSFNCDVPGSKWDTSTTPPTPPPENPGFMAECKHISKAILCRLFTNRDAVELNEDVKGFHCKPFELDDQYSKTGGFCTLKQKGRCGARLLACARETYESIPRTPDGKVSKEAMKTWCDDQFHWGHTDRVDKWIKENTPKERRSKCDKFGGGTIECWHPISPNTPKYFWDSNPCYPVSSQAPGGAPPGGMQGGATKTELNKNEAGDPNGNGSSYGK